MALGIKKKSNVLQVSEKSDGLHVVAYPGDNAVLIAMSLDEGALDNLAGFAIWRTHKGKPEEALPNRLNFTTQITQDTTPAQRNWTPSDQAPFQKFRWVDVPADGFDDTITYRVQARYFTGQGTELRDGAQTTVTVDPPDIKYRKFHIAFTRGYISSQAYADRFKNADIRPKGKKTPDFDTKPYQEQYQWLGADARKHLFDFLKDCKKDASSSVDVFAYDLDEPDVIDAICELGQQGRIRAILDNAPLHTGDAPEVRAAALIKKALGEQNVRQGHFARFQHNKVFIKRDKTGTPQRVLFGSMNFSVRGIYVQANNVIVGDDPTTAGYFGHAFDNAFRNKVAAPPFKSDPVAQQYNQISAGASGDLPKAAVALSPHTDSAISLGEVAKHIRNSQSSVLFAVMEPKGTGPVLSSLRAIAERPTVFSYGTVETDNGLAVQNADGAMGALTSFAYLKSQVPWPFSAEFDPGPGKHIHHKFVVVDFNDEKPVVFTGSSNLAAGGEEANGDSLVMIEDPLFAGIYAVEAVRLFDHYQFRKTMKTATKAAPLTLWFPSKQGAPNPWWKPYYDETNIKFRDRLLFAHLPLPPDMLSRKNVDWNAIDEADHYPAGKSKPKGSSATRNGARKGTRKGTGKGTRKTSSRAAPARAGGATRGGTTRKSPAAKQTRAVRKRASAKRAHRGAATKRTPSSRRRSSR